jgi:hypothetical protein
VTPHARRRSTGSAAPITILAAYQQLEDDTLSTLPRVRRLNSTVVMNQVVDNRPLPA